ncbi:1-deoxy-D-xylulose-5-phosphate reductoisomerase [soil metagenome]
MIGARKVSVLGSTGSIGVSTLDLLDHAVRGGEAQIEVRALAAGRNVKLLAEQAKRWRPALTVIADETCLDDLNDALSGEGLRNAAGDAAVVEAAAGVGADWVMAAIVGSAGLRPTLAAAQTGAVIALANKESLVCMGPALLAAAKAAGGSVIPVDSEHSAIFQVLQPEAADRVRRLILTASGGPFRTWEKARMAAATPAQAVAHPNWSMGAKISVDSASMMNKGLEMIEASYLFATPEEKIDVVVHPQSVVHSLVEYQDGSTLAQLGPPDMKAPIACALSWPRRIAWPAEPMDLAKWGSLTFEAPDLDRFPALTLARDALRQGGGAPAAFNAANEAAVAAFLAGRIGFLDIAAVVSETLSTMNFGAHLAGEGEEALEAAMSVDRSARTVAEDVLLRRPVHD